jgi:hypothetical protein
LDKLIVNTNTIEPPMEAPKVENDLENKEPLIIEAPIKLPERVNLNIHCNRCIELKAVLELIGISLGVTSFVLVIWLITGR